MRRRLRWTVNILFVAVSIVLVSALVYGFQKRQGQENRTLPGFEVFLEGDEISALFPAGDSLWVGGRDGVKRLDTGTGEVLDYVAEDLELIYAAEIVQASDGSVWIGHNDGVTALLPDGRRTDYGEPGLTGGRVNTILAEEDRVYVGTMQGANVFHLSEEGWQLEKQYTKENGLISDPVNVLERAGDLLWFGSYLDNHPGGISILSPDGWQYLTIEEGLAHPYINAILPLKDQVLIATGQMTAGGLNVATITGNKAEITDSYSVEDGIPGEKVRWLYQDSSGHLWITTESDGLLLCRSSVLDHPIDGVLLTEQKGLSDNEIKKIVEMDGFYWLAGRYGLTRIEKNAVNRLF